MTKSPSFVPRLRTYTVGIVALILLGVTGSIAQAPIIQPGIPGQPSREISVAEASDLASIEFTEADVRFMQGMISHHAQALEMTVFVDSRTNREAMELLSRRITLSQEDEIAMMQGWLGDRNLTVTAVDAHFAPGFRLMPGMLTVDELEQLEQSDGFEFDSLFLELMIMHHEGALTMVENLLDQSGSAQDSVLFAFTADITSDQSSEIDRMLSMLTGFSPDPRVNLSAGFEDAGQASMNMELVSALSKPDGFFDPSNPGGLPLNRPEPGAETSSAEDAEADGAQELRPSILNFANSDMAFAGDVLIAGNYHGFNAYNIGVPGLPELVSSVVCPGGQGDVSVVGNLLIYSVEQTRGRLDCGLQGVAEPVSADRFRGIRIFDISDFRAPRQVGAVQTCRGSHTHTIVTDPDNDGSIYVYASGTGPVRSGEELEGCSDESPFEDSETALFSIDVIQIPLARPEEARIVNRPRIFSDPESGVIAGLWEGGDHGEGTQTTRRTNQCHDITTYPEIGLAAGACAGNGILLDISDPVNPVRLDQVIDPGFAYWHSATFNNDGTKVLFTDEWGGGGRPRCRASDPQDWGADAIYDIVDGKLQFRSHYKMSAPQSEQENCVAHNGSLIPVPGRDIFVQAWYQGGISVVDFTDSSNPVEIAFFDRGPIDGEELVMGGYWSAYWFGGLIYGTEIARGLDVLSLLPSEYLSADEIAAASFQDPDAIVNAQTQRRYTWPAEPVVARAYLDQLERANLISSEQSGALRQALDLADNALSGGGGSNQAAATQLDSLADTLSREVAGQSDATRAKFLALSGTVEGIADRLR